MAVNGVEIKVGQVWRTRGGERLRVESNWVSGKYRWFLMEDRTRVTEDGRFWPDKESNDDLVELVEGTPAAQHPFADLVKEVFAPRHIDPRKDLGGYEAAERERAAVHEYAQLAKANATQVGGAHYKTSEIQPWDYIVANDIGFLAGNVIKYVTRFDKKNGVEDLKKARHYLDKLIETEGGAA